MYSKKRRKIFCLNKRKIIFLIVLSVFINTGFFIYYFTSRLGEVMLDAAEREIYNITSWLVINNITREKLRYIAIDDIIIVNKNNQGEVTDIDFRLDVVYEMLLDLRTDLDRAAIEFKLGDVPENSIVLNDNLIIKVPFYAYTNNPLLMNLGPRISFKVNLLEVIRGEVITTVSDYGINTILINVFLNLYVTQSVILPMGREVTDIDFEILIASRVIQGRVPSFFAGGFESHSGIINLE